jgi:hypothetical protein
MNDCVLQRDRQEGGSMAAGTHQVGSYRAGDMDERSIEDVRPDDPMPLFRQHRNLELRCALRAGAITVLCVLVDRPIANHIDLVNAEARST